MSEKITLTEQEVQEAANSQWGGNTRVATYSNTDGVRQDKVKSDIATGNFGESCARRLMLLKGYPVGDLNFKTMKQGVWKDDLFVQMLTIKTSNGTVVHVNEHVSCKAQRAEQSDTYGLSWTFQLQSYDGRSADPLLMNRNEQELLCCVKMNSQSDGEVYCFYWPEVCELLADPIVPHLRGKKKVLYYDDIKHLECEIIPYG